MKTDIIKDKPLEEFAILVFYLNSLLLANGNRLTKDLGQSSARWHVLGQANAGVSTVAEIARNMGQARQSVQRIADTLVKEGYLVYVPHPSDKRTKHISVTKNGKDIIEQINHRNNEWTRKVTPEIGEELLKEINASLRYIAQVINAHK